MQRVKVSLVREPGAAPRHALDSPGKVYDIVKDLAERDRETFEVLHLDTRNHLIARETISVGTLTASLVHPREVFAAAVTRGTAGIILVHNHPSGNPSPSREDREVTRRLVDAGKLLGIPVLDHLIVGEERWFSFASEGGLT